MIKISCTNRAKQPRARQAKCYWKTRYWKCYRHIIGGTLRLLHLNVKALIDPGASHSYIAQRLIYKLNMTLIPLSYTLEFNTLLGESWLVQEVYRESPITIKSEILLTHLVPLPLSEFEVILGMDCLTKYYVILDCRKKIITFRIPEGDRFTYLKQTFFFESI